MKQINITAGSWKFYIIREVQKEYGQIKHTLINLLNFKVSDYIDHKTKIEGFIALGRNGYH